mmetsp:Transcript_23577/g.19799  ORF Transcript_23577/g.19799 Transcript_23577/m.19799 type:complete len:87 (+) Transcript_23577:2-262(+)
MKGDKDHGGFKGCSKKKWQSRGPIKKSKTEKESSPFNVFMKAELAPQEGGPGDGREDFQKESYLGVDCNTKRQMSPVTYSTPEWDV